MKHLLISSVVLWLCLTGGVRGQMVTPSEAETVANNWVTLILQKEGHWGAFDTASVQDVQGLWHGETLIGYLCSVRPKGFIVISLRKELPPVRAYSETSDLSPLVEGGMAGLLKEQMKQILEKIEATTDTQDVSSMRSAQDAIVGGTQSTWDVLNADVQTFAEEVKSGTTKLNYQGGNPPLLSSEWHQGYPYNSLCPFGDACHTNCPVGCTPLAGAQIMRYWAWPPIFDWTQMPDRDPVGEQQIGNVAALCRSIGAAAGAVYCVLGADCETFCFLSFPFGPDLLDAFEDHFSYNSAADEEVRVGETPEEWFNYFKTQLNQNRPVPYELGTGMHTVVCDGWKEIGSTQYLHFNYGWADTNTTWWELDTQPKLGPGEHIIIRLYPECALGSWLSGDPPDDLVAYERPDSTYRYFDQDTCGRNVFFAAGHNLQFLPAVSARGTSPVGHCIRFIGLSGSLRTRMFSIKGTATGGSLAGVRIHNAEVRLHSSGGIRFH